MAKKDPAVLFFTATWLVATKGMKAEAKGWFLNLILFQFDQKSLPNDIEELANLCDVRFSEFNTFKQVWEQVLKHKFKLNGDGRLINSFAEDIIRGREEFVEKRSDAGKMSAFSKHIRKYSKADESEIYFIKQHTLASEISDCSFDLLQQVYEQKHQLYINTIKNTNTDSNTNEDKQMIPGVLSKYKEAFDNDYQLDLKAARENGFNPEQLADAKTKFWNRKELDEEMLGKKYSDVQKHFLNWCALHKNKILNPNGNGNNNIKGSGRTGNNITEITGAAEDLLRKHTSNEH